MGNAYQTVDFSASFSIPHFMLILQSRDNSCEFGNSAQSEKLQPITFFSEKHCLLLEYYNILPPPKIVENQESALILLGSPILNNHAIDREKTAHLLLADSSITTIKNSLNGEFLIIKFSKKHGSLDIINDRWCSIPLHYYFSKEKELFCASPFFTSLWIFLKENGLLQINNEAFFEFIWFQRLFGTKTLAKNTLFMPDAHQLTLKNWNLELQRYWQRKYEKNKNSFEENAQTLAYLIRESIKLKTSDSKKYGHFLSGGMDSRTVLAGFQNNFPICFTVGISDNREVKTARKIATTKGTSHIFLQLDTEHYGKIREPAVIICGGMYNYDHAIFLGYENTVKQHAEVCFNGYGFDFMFQGMYIPGKNLKIFGRNLHFWLLNELPENLCDFFIRNASYRIKGADILHFIEEKKKIELMDFLRSSISEVLNQGKQLTDNKYDLWEYLTFHHISRHYSYPNVLSIKTFAEARIISFTNEIFDFYLSLPLEHRFDGRIEKRVLQILDKSLAEIPSANTGMPVTANRLERTFHQIKNAALRRLQGKKDFESWTERTWPSREYSIRKQNSLKNFALKLISTNTFEKLDFFDCNKLKEKYKLWLEGEESYGFSGDLAQTLITTGTFLEI